MMRIERLRGKCGVCLHDLDGGQLISCSHCGSTYHEDCWTFNRRKCAVYGCWKSPFPKRPLGPPQRHADIFNPFVTAALVLLMLAVFAWNWIRFTGL
jgi:hypothetical protein